MGSVMEEKRVVGCNGHELKDMNNLEIYTFDSRSNVLYPSNVLSNLCSNSFRFNGMHGASMEELFQSLKRMLTSNDKH